MKVHGSPPLLTTHGINHPTTPSTCEMETATAKPTNGIHRHEKQRDGEASGSSSLDIAVVGAGIIGVMTAFELLHAGHKVTVYERAEWVP